MSCGSLTFVLAANEGRKLRVTCFGVSCGNQSYAYAWKDPPGLKFKGAQVRGYAFE